MLLLFLATVKLFAPNVPARSLIRIVSPITALAGRVNVFAPPVVSTKYPLLAVIVTLLFAIVQVNELELEPPLLKLWYASISAHWLLPPDSK